MKRHAIILSALIVPALAFAGEHGDQAKMGEEAKESAAWGEEKAGEYGEQAGEAAEYGQQEAKEYGQQAQHAAASAQDTQQIKGQVEKVNLKKGELKVKASDTQEEYTLHGTPSQIRQYQEGQQVDVEARKFGDNHWLTSKSAEQAAGGKTIQATVASVQEDKGEIELDTDPGKLRANPQDLEQLQPGQQVSVTFEEVEGENWVSSISQQEQQPGMEGQMQEQEREMEREMEGMDEPDPMME